VSATTYALLEKSTLDRRSGTADWYLRSLATRYPSEYRYPEPELETLLAEWERPALSFEKQWDIVHYLACGHAGVGEEPVSFSVRGGATITPTDADDAVCVVEADVVATISEALLVQPYDVVSGRLLSRPQSDIYGWGPFTVEDIEWYRAPYMALVSYYARAAAVGHSMLCWLV
jgi:hypothetical protein